MKFFFDRNKNDIRQQQQQQQQQHHHHIERTQLYIILSLVLPYIYVRAYVCVRVCVCGHYILSHIILYWCDRLCRADHARI